MISPATGAEGTLPRLLGFKGFLRRSRISKCWCTDEEEAEAKAVAEPEDLCSHNILDDEKEVEAVAEPEDPYSQDIPDDLRFDEYTSVVPSLTPFSCRLFCSHQHTEKAKAMLDQWLPKGFQSAKASTPPFNLRPGVALPKNCVEYNMAMFGVKLPEALMKLFESDDMVKLSQELLIPLPKFGLDTFVQKMMISALDIVEHAREKRHGLSSADLKAVEKMENFIVAFAELDAETITSSSQFKKFVGKFANPGWEDHLHFDSILVHTFGMSPAASEKLRRIRVQRRNPDAPGGVEEVSLEHSALRWVAKAFNGYGPIGSMSDVLNLVYAMLSLPKQASEAEAVAAVLHLKQCLDEGRLDKLWIPTHLIHDGEADDSLSWLLLEHVHRISQSKLAVLTQLPADAAIDEVSRFFEQNFANTQTFRDQDSQNAGVLLDHWNPIVRSTLAK